MNRFRIMGTTGAISITKICPPFGGTLAVPYYVSYSDGSVDWRKGVRDGAFVYDKAITPTGFLGAEDTDWVEVSYFINT